MLHEHAHVAASLAQRRQLDDDDREPVVQIEAEATAVHLGAEIAVRRRDDAHVDRDVVLAADAPDAPPLEHAEQVRLDRERELADLVEEERAAVRALERADVRAIGAGERAALVPEELALDERRDDRRAVDDDERTARCAGSLRGARSPRAPCRCPTRR